LAKLSEFRDLLPGYMHCCTFGRQSSEYFCLIASIKTFFYIRVANGTGSSSQCCLLSVAREGESSFFGSRVNLIAGWHADGSATLEQMQVIAEGLARHYYRVGDSILAPAKKKEVA